MRIATDRCRFPRFEWLMVGRLEVGDDWVASHSRTNPEDHNHESIVLPILCQDTLLTLERIISVLFSCVKRRQRPLSGEVSI